MDRTFAPTTFRARLLLLPAAALFALSAANPAAAAIETCFGMAPTFGCRVNGKVGPCVGTQGRDRIRGTRGDDVIVALGGDDRVSGGRGNDIICGGEGNDRLRDGVGNDRIDGQAGDDDISGGRDNDVLIGGPGIDNLVGGKGLDRIEGGEGADRIFAGSDDDWVDGGDEADAVKGGRGTDACAVESPATDCETTTGAAPEIYSAAGGCFALGARAGDTQTFLATSGADFAFSAADAASGTPLHLRTADLGVFLLRDPDGGYLTGETDGFGRSTDLQSDILLIDDSYQSEAEWVLTRSAFAPEDLVLFNIARGQYLTTTGLTEDESLASALQLVPATGCADFPELTVDATGTVTPRTWGDGAVYGFVDAHSHILSNFGFGGGGIFHGAPFHRLGVEHALSDCTRFHGVEGRQDLFGYGFDQGDSLDGDALLDTVVNGETPTPNHATEGYPTFTDWPSAHDSSTHQVQYYKWIERAYLSGLRLVVQHATTNAVICQFLVGLGLQPVRYSCNDMVAVDRIIDETYAMERYIDAQAGGPGLGFFRIVKSPAEARAIISQGKMAVVLGIETAHIFDCFVTPSPAHPACTEADVLAKLDEYHDRGVRALFPVHKYDNAFSAGDGDKGILELGNFIQSRYYNNYTQDCDASLSTTFDKGPLTFPGINAPRAEYQGPLPLDTFGLRNFENDPLLSLGRFLDQLTEPPLDGDFCQNAGLTPLGEFFVREIMDRGMILEIDHLPRRSYKRVFEIMVENDYPAAGTHGQDNFGALYALGGISTSGFGRCRSQSTPATMDNGFQNRLSSIVANGGYPGLGFGFDLNGFAGAPGPRFGDGANCGDPQTDPVTYPFTSYDGDITFTQPAVGNRTIDFNTEGLAHLGLVAELIEDVRGDGVTDEELEPLFRSAEAYIRMWEKAEARGAALGD
jgi:microsomal dipeptidase-like Zn-dependent dipeptidase